MVDIMELTDFVPKSFQDKLEEECLKIPHFYTDSIGYNKDTANIPFLEDQLKFTDNPGFSHSFVLEGNVNSDRWSLVSPLLLLVTQKTGIDFSEVLFCRSRLTVQSPNHTLEDFNAPHVDVYKNSQYHTIVYYVNDSDGDTIIFDKKFDIKTYDPNDRRTFSVFEDDKILLRSTPKKGNALLFDGFYYHSGNTPVNFKYRQILNFDIVIKK